MNNKVEKTVSVLMWIVVALTVLVFFATIMLGHAGYNLLFGLEDNTTEVVKTAVQSLSTSTYM